MYKEDEKNHIPFTICDDFIFKNFLIPLYAYCQEEEKIL